MTNEERADRALKALIAYAGHDQIDIADHLPDLICDLGHLARRNEQEPLDSYNSGIRNFLAEEADAPDGMRFEFAVEINHTISCDHGAYDDDPSGT